MIRCRTITAVMLLCAAAGGCARARAASLGMPDSTFVATLSELRRAETDTSLGVTMRDSTRRLILRRHNVTTAKLEAASRILAGSPERASDLWRQIESVRRPAPPRPAPSPRPGAAPDNNHPVQH